MIQIDPNSLYTRADLAELLESSGVDVDTFIGKIRPRKVFRHLFFGKDLLVALEAAPAIEDQKNAPIIRAQNRGSRMGQSAARKAGDRLRTAFKPNSGETL